MDGAAGSKPDPYSVSMVREVMRGDAATLGEPRAPEGGIGERATKEGDRMGRLTALVMSGWTPRGESNIESAVSGCGARGLLGGSATTDNIILRRMSSQAQKQSEGRREAKTNKEFERGEFMEKRPWKARQPSPPTKHLDIWVT
jgi:hypothetical protein